jgi:hypothetical protein
MVIEVGHKRRNLRATLHDRVGQLELLQGAEATPRAVSLHHHVRKERFSVVADITTTMLKASSSVTARL